LASDDDSTDKTNSTSGSARGGGGAPSVVSKTTGRFPFLLFAHNRRWEEDTRATEAEGTTTMGCSGSKATTLALELEFEERFARASALESPRARAVAVLALRTRFLEEMLASTGFCDIQRPTPLPDSRRTSASESIFEPR
jgi:hypothetical protein